jgi:hypothetical protein
MSTLPIQQHADDDPWLRRVNAALKAVRTLHRTVFRQNGSTGHLTRQLRCLTRARAAWLAGDRVGAQRFLTAALNQGDET